MAIAALSRSFLREKLSISKLLQFVAVDEPRTIRERIAGAFNGKQLVFVEQAEEPVWLKGKRERTCNAPL